jgi:hypothetical protein
MVHALPSSQVTPAGASGGDHLAVACAADDARGADLAEVLASGVRARDGVYGAAGRVGGGSPVEVAEAGGLICGSRLNDGDSAGYGLGDHIVATQIDRRRGRRHAEGREERREDERRRRRGVKPGRHEISPGMSRSTADGRAPEYANGPGSSTRKPPSGLVVTPAASVCWRSPLPSGRMPKICGPRGLEPSGSQLEAKTTASVTASRKTTR